MKKFSNIFFILLSDINTNILWPLFVGMFAGFVMSDSLGFFTANTVLMCFLAICVVCTGIDELYNLFMWLENRKNSTEEDEED